MPIIRCREFDDDGRPLRGTGCSKGIHCRFVHPDNGYWATAPRNDPVPRRSLPFPSDRGRGRGRGRGAPPTEFRDRTGSNTVPLRSSGGASGWASRIATPPTVTWGSGWDTSVDKGKEKGKEKEKDEGSSTAPIGWGSGWGSDWGAGWDSADDAKKDSDTSIDKGKGKAAESSSGGWAEEAAKNDSISWSDWGSSAEWPEAGPKEPKSSSAVFGQSNDPGISRRSTVSPVSDRRRMSETSALDDKVKNNRPESLRLSSAEPSSKAEIDSPLSSIAPPVTSWRDSKPLMSPDIHNRPTSPLKPSSTPDISAQSSRAGSVVPPNALPRPKVIRSLRSVSFKDARNVWSEYIDLIRRPISLRLFLTQERAFYKDYKTAQNSSVYTKVGREGTNLLDESSRRVKMRLEREDKAYKAAVDKLCAFEEGYDFVLHALTGRSVDKAKMREELAGLKDHLGEAKSCVDGMQATGNDIETKAHAAVNPVASSVPAAKEEKKEETEEVEPTTTPSQDRDINDRLVVLKDKSLELHGEFLDARSSAEVKDIVKNKVEEMNMSLLESLRPEEEFSEVDKLGEEQASLGRDLEQVCNEVAEILELLGNTESSMQGEIDRLERSLNEEQRLLERSEECVRECQDSLEKSVENLSSLRQGIQTLEERHKKSSLPPGVSEELLDQLIASLLPIIRVQLYPDIESALRLLTSSAVNAVRERDSLLMALTTMLGPLLEIIGPSSKIEARQLNIPKQLPIPSVKNGEAGLSA